MKMQFWSKMVIKIQFKMVDKTTLAISHN